MYSSPPPSSILLLCILVHDSPSCVLSFGCHPCASPFPSCLPLYFSSSFLPDDSLAPVSALFPSLSIVSLLPGLSLSLRLFPTVSSPPPIALLFPLWTWLGLLVSGWCVLLWFPLVSSAPPPFFPLFIYSERWKDECHDGVIDGEGSQVTGCERFMGAPVSQGTI